MSDDAMKKPEPTPFEVHIAAALAALKGAEESESGTWVEEAQVHALLAIAHAIKSAGLMSAVGGGMNLLGGILGRVPVTPVEGKPKP